MIIHVKMTCNSGSHFLINQNTPFQAFGETKHREHLDLNTVCFSSYMLVYSAALLFQFILLRNLLTLSSGLLDVASVRIC